MTLFDKAAARLHLTTLFGALEGVQPEAYAALAVGIGWDPVAKSHADWEEHQFPSALAST